MKDIIKIGSELIKRIENNKTNQIKSLFFLKFYKIDKPLSNLTKRKTREKKRLKLK